jgi:hypothetical protein
VKYTVYKFAQVVALLTCVLQVSGSNLGQNSDYPDMIHRHSTMLSVIRKFINVLLKRVGGIWSEDERITFKHRPTRKVHC